jgi:hypothetical protein
LGWGDIGYNALVDKSGNSYEGRYGRVLSDGTRATLRDGVVAGHAAYHNYGATGIALLGNFEQASPSTEALYKLLGILIFACGYHGVDPKGASDFLRYDDFWNRGLANVCGHRNCNNTACPGANLYAQLPALREQVSAALAVANPAAPTAQITTGPDGVTVVGGKASYQWSGTGSQYQYYLEGWRIDKLTGNVKYLAGFNGDQWPTWGNWTDQISKAYSSLSAGHYTFHIRSGDSLGNPGVYEANATFLAKGFAKK